jgi:hypothetical protein
MVKKLKLLVKRLFGSRRKKLIALLLLLGIAAATIALISKNNENEPSQPEQQEKHYSVLTGLEVDEEASKQSVLGVMIENSEAARPQTGLANAGIVFETTTEGGITRYLALYQEDIPEIIGPVRSVRPAFVDWVMGFDAAIAHVGGSAVALDAINQRETKSLNEFFNPEPYYRSDEREAPHNMYAETRKLLTLQNEKGFHSSSFKIFERSEESPAPEPIVTQINVDFSTPSFSTQYRYDSESNNYVRYLSGEPHIDQASGEPITVKNVIVLQMGDAIDAIGTGKAYVFKDGAVIEGTWEKTSYDEQITFTEVVDGEEKSVSINRGASWVAAIPSTGNLTY